MKSRRRWIVLFGLTGILCAGLGLGAMGWLGWLGTPSGQVWLGERIAEAGTEQVQGSVEIGSLETDLWSRLDLRQLSILDEDGEVVAEIQRLHLVLDPDRLGEEQIWLSTVEVDRPSLSLVMASDGKLNLLEVLPLEEPARDETLFSRVLADWTFQVADLEVLDASMSFRDEQVGAPVPALVARVETLDLSFEQTGDGVRVDGLDLLLDLEAPVQQQLHLQGALSYGKSGLDVHRLELGLVDLNVELSGAVARVASSPFLDLELDRMEIGPEIVEELVGSRVLSEPLDVHGSLRGPLNGLMVAAGADLDTGELEIEIAADLEAPEPRWSVLLRTEEVDLQTLTPLMPVPIQLTAELGAAGHGTDPYQDMMATWRVDAGPVVLEDETLDRLEATGRLESGRLWMHDILVSHELGEARLGGSLDLKALDLDVQVDAQVPSLGSLPEIAGAPPVEGAATVSTRVQTRLTDEVLVARLDGELGASKLSLEGARVSQVSAPFSGNVMMTSASLGGRLDAHGISQDQIEAQSLSSAHWEATWSELDGLVLQADLTLERVSLGDDAIRIGTIDGSLVGHSSEVQPLSLKSEMMVRDVAMGPAGYRAEGGEVSAWLDGDRVRLTFDLSRRARPFFRGEVEGDLFSQEWIVQDLMLAPKSDRPLRSLRPVSVRLADGGVRDLDLALGGSAGQVEIEGDWLEIHTGASDLRFQLEDLDIPYLLDVAGLYDPGLIEAIDPRGIRGKVSLSGHLVDSLDGMQVQSSGELRGFAWEDVAQLPLVELGVEGWLDRPEIWIRASDEHGPILDVAGALPLVTDVDMIGLDCERDAVLEGSLALSDDARIGRLAPGLELPEGLGSAVVRLTGPACDPQLSLVASGEVVVAESSTRARLDLDVTREGEEVDLRLGVEEGLARRLDVSGRLETGLGDVLAWALEGAAEPDLEDIHTWVRRMDIAVVPLDIPMDSVARLVSVPSGVHGRIAGGFSVTGDPMEPQINVGLLLLEGRIGAADVPLASFELSPERDGYHLNLQVQATTGGLSVEGHVPLALDLSRGLEQDLNRSGLDLQVLGAGLPLEMMVGLVEDVSEAEGMLEVSGGVGGTLEVPVPRLEIKTRDAAFAYTVTGVRYTRLDLWARLLDDHFFLHRLEVESEPLWSRIQASPGSASVDGQATLDGLALDQIRMNMTADGFWLSNIPMATLRVDGDIQIKGRTPRLIFRGKGKLVEGRMSFDESWFMERQDLALDSSIAIHRASMVRFEDTGTEEQREIWDPFDVEVDLDLDRNLRMVAHVPMEYAMGKQLAALSTVGADVDLDSTDELKVIWRNGEPNLIGTVEVYDGSLYMMGRQFNVGAGEVSWTGGDYLDPILDLQASKNTRGYGEVSTRVSGSLEAVDVSFDSEEYPDQTDILSILLLGKPASELAGSEAQVGAQMLGAAIAMAAGRQFSRALGSTFMGQVALDQDALKVGFPLGEKAFLELQRRSLAEADENVMELRLEWLIMQRMYFEFVSGDRGQGSADVYRRWRF